MALLNAQYDAIMRGYDEIRDRHRHELSDREAEIAQKIPAISALDDEAAAFHREAAGGFHYFVLVHFNNSSRVNIKNSEIGNARKSSPAT